jgi:hypothetical protein
MLLSDAEYITRAGVPFVVPLHPGEAPAAAAGAAAAQIAEAIRVYNQTLADATLYNRLSAALTAQIITAVNASFLSALRDSDFGFSDVSPHAILVHLRTKYGTMTPEELERNRIGALSEPWNLDERTHRGSVGQDFQHPTRCSVRTGPNSQSYRYHAHPCNATKKAASWMPIQTN